MVIALNLVTTPAMFPFSPEDDRGAILLLLITAMMAAALVASLLLIYLRRRRTRRMLEERVAEQEALIAAGRALVAAELNLDALCNLIAEQAGQIIDNRTFQVGLFDEGYYDIRYWTIDGVPQPVPQVFDLEAQHSVMGEARGLVGWVRDSQQPLLVGDFEREMGQLPARPNYESESPPRSALFLPLISGGRTLGIVSAQSRRPYHYGEQDLRQLTILANQAAAAIANAQLFAQERTRAVHLEMVSRIAVQANAAEDAEGIMEQVVSLTHSTFGFHPVSVFRVEPDSRMVVVQASSMPELRPERPDDSVEATRLLGLPIGYGIVGAAAEMRHTVVVNSTAEDDRYLLMLEGMAPESVPDTRSEIAIPLVVNNEFLGVLDVQSPEVGAFGTTERMVLEALAAEVAGAVYKAQQWAREQEQAWVTTAQLQVAEAIGRHDDRDEMLEAVARLAPILAGVEICGFFAWNEDKERYLGMTLADAVGSADEHFTQLELGIGDWSTLDAVHVGCEALTTTQIPAWLDKWQPACLRLYPLISSQGKNLGVMVVGLNAADACVESGEKDHPNASAANPREELILNIARQTGQALERTYLRLAQQEEAWVNTALLQVAEAVNSLTDLNEILDTIVRLVPLLVGIDSVFILIWNDERQVFNIGPSYGVSSMGRGLVETLEVDRDEFMAMSPQLAQEYDLSRQPNTGYYPLRVPVWLETVLNTPVVYGFPLVARGQLVGAQIVGLQQDRHGRASVSPRRFSILNGIAQQAATAVVNNQLYKESAERVRMQQELDVAHTIQASFLPDGSPDIPGCSVATLWQAARQVGGDFYDFLPLGDDKWGIVIADVADKGVPAALFMALSRTILRTVAFNRDDPAHVLMRSNEIIGREARADLFVTMFYGIWDPATDQFTYSNAGHNPPLLLKTNGEFRVLTGNGIALGVLPEVHMESQSVRLRPGETIILYTDGVTEALNEDFDEFGLERLQVAARAAAGQPSSEMVKHIDDSIRDHTGQTPQFDDMTLIVMKRRRGKSEKQG